VLPALLAGDEQQQFEFCLHSTPLHTWAHHPRTARGVGSGLSDCLAWSDARHFIGLHLDADWLVQVPNSRPPLPLPLPFPHTSQVHTHGIRAAGDPSSVAGAPVSKRCLSKHHRSCPPIRVRYQSMTSAPAVVQQQWWRAGGDSAHPGQARLLEFLLSIIIIILIILILILIIIITAPFAPSCCLLRATLRLAGAVPPQRGSRPHSHLRSE
jgi:hypothetical protein